MTSEQTSKKKTKQCSAFLQPPLLSKCARLTGTFTRSGALSVRASLAALGVSDRWWELQQRLPCGSRCDSYQRRTNVRACACLAATLIPSSSLASSETLPASEAESSEPPDPPPLPLPPPPLLRHPPAASFKTHKQNKRGGRTISRFHLRRSQTPKWRIKQNSIVFG